jgi:hypothetical protein
VLQNATLSRYQKTLLHFHRSQVIDTSESEEESDFDKIMKDLEHKKVINRIFALGRINRSVRHFTEHGKLSDLDIRLLKGFYTSNP